MEPTKHSPSTSASESSSATSRSDNEDVRQSKRYSGRSRTTRWRMRKKCEETSSESNVEQPGQQCEDEDTTDIDEVWIDTYAGESSPESVSGSQNVYQTMEAHEITDDVDDELHSGSCDSSNSDSEHDGISTSAASEHEEGSVVAPEDATKNLTNQLGGGSSFTSSINDADLYLSHSSSQAGISEEGRLVPKVATVEMSELCQKNPSNKLHSYSVAAGERSDVRESSSALDSSSDNSDSDDTRSQLSESEYCPSSEASESPDSMDFSSDLECFEAHYLDEEPEQAQPVAQPLDNEDDDEADEDEVGNDDFGLPDGQEDPNSDPDDPDDSSSSSSDEDNGNDREVGTFHNMALNRNVQLLGNLTKGEVVALQLANAVRHNMTFESLIDHFKNLNLLFGPHFFPESKSKLWAIILINKTGIQFHIYCGRRNCCRYLGRRDRLVGFARCRCGYRVNIEKARFFVTLDIETQLKYFLSIPGIWDKLQYPLTRQKVSPTATEDVMDGSRYRRWKEPGGPLENPHNFSYFFSLDACNANKKGSLKLLPFYIRINELPPELRQKFSFLVAVFCDHYEPSNYQAFLKPIVRMLRRLSTQGITWKPDGVNEIVSRFYCLGFNVDSPVRCGILHMSKWDSREYGCTYCTHRGIRVAGSQRYPEVNLHGIPPFEDRNHDGMIAAMIRVERDPNRNFIQGHHGPSMLMLVNELDLREGQAHDDLHQDHEGCTADLTELLLTVEDARVVQRMTTKALLQNIDRRLLSIKTPSRLSRKPRSITKRANYNGSEWRNWLIFYAVPCLSGLIKPQYLDILASLSYACYLLSQDVIEEAEIDEAERLLLRVGQNFERTFGVGRLKYNLHLTTKHKVRSVRNLGNPGNYSTYNYESLHRKIIARVTSPKGAHMQIITRLMLHMIVHASQYDERLAEDVRLRIEEILNPYQLQGIRRVAPHMHLVGRGNARAVNEEEALMFRREGINVHNIVEYKSCLIGSTRYKSLRGQNQNIKSDDTFVYTWQETFCTIRTVCSFMNDNGEERSGIIVMEHDVIEPMPLSRHISILRNNAEADLLHYIPLDQIRCPAVRMNIENVLHVSCVPNCLEID